MMLRRKIAFLIPALVAGGATLGLAGCSEKAPSFTAIDITGAEYARDFPLPDHNGRQRSVRDFAGKVVVVTGAGSGIGRAMSLRFAQEGENDHDPGHQLENGEAQKGACGETESEER